MKIACIILNFNDAERTLNLAEPVSTYSTINDVILVDNCSTDDSASKLKEHSVGNIHFLQTDKNGGYGYGNNVGLKFAFDDLGADAALIVNPDVTFDNDLVDRISNALAAEPEAGVISAMQLDADGTENARTAWHIPSKLTYIMSTGLILGRLAKSFYYPLGYLHEKSCVPTDCVSGSLLLMSKAAFEKTGGYDERMFLYCEETTLGCKLKKAKMKAYICSDVGYFHLHGQSITRSIKSTAHLKAIMLKSHHLLLKEYLGANRIELVTDTIVGKLGLLEECVKTFLRKASKKGK